MRGGYFHQMASREAKICRVEQRGGSRGAASRISIERKIMQIHRKEAARFCRESMRHFESEPLKSKKEKS